ncbi:MAG: glycosyltransferase [Lapillicoccus sp.]
MRIIGFGTYDRARHPRVGILLDGLTDLGDDVVELNRPLGFSTAERVAMLRRPWTAYRMGLRILSCWAALVRARRGVPRPDAVIVGYLGQFDVVLARLLFPRSVIALDLLIFGADTATDRGLRRGLRMRVLSALDDLAMRCADVIVVDTDEHEAMVPERHRGRCVVVPVGSPEKWFAPPPIAPRGADDPLRVIFYGLFTPLQGASVIGPALAALGHTSLKVTVVGSGQDLDATRAAAGAAWASVTWHEWLDPDALTLLVQQQDVCLGIFGDTGKGLRVTPNKVYQGAAAGCVVVTSDTPPQRRALGDAALYVRPGDATALARTLLSLAGDPDGVVRMRRMAYDRAKDAFAPPQVAERAQLAMVDAVRHRSAR